MDRLNSDGVVTADFNADLRSFLSRKSTSEFTNGSTSETTNALMIIFFGVFLLGLLIAFTCPALFSNF